MTNTEYDADESALYGACGVANHAGMTELQLDAGADPDDDESLYHACEHFDTTCQELLHARGADPDDLSYRRPPRCGKASTPTANRPSTNC